MSNLRVQKVIGDTNFLPHSPGDAKRIRGTGQLIHVESRPKPVNTTGFSLLGLYGNPTITWPPDVPDRDPRGHKRARDFENWKKAQDSKFGIPGNVHSFKGFGLVPCLSWLERRHLFHLEMNPFVVEIRGQYPEWERGKRQRYRSIGERLPKTGIFTVDFVVTVKIPGRSGFHYHAISSKEYRELAWPETQRRHEREIAALRLWGCTHEIWTEDTISIREAHNNQRLVQYMRWAKQDDIERRGLDARRFAAALLQTKAKGDRDRVITLVARRFGWSRDEGYRVYAIAHFLGYLSCDHERDLLPNAPFFSDESRTFRQSSIQL